MNTTQNATTWKINNCEATCILATKSPHGDDPILYTMELVYPRYIHAEVMTHRVFSRNAQSSRATPTKTLIREVRQNPVVPAHWYEAQKGMVGGEELDADTSKKLEGQWRAAAAYAGLAAEAMMNLGAHKQHVNRVLEPFLPIKVIVTATDWDNFFKLRLAPDAQPEIQDLAKAIQKSQELARKFALEIGYSHLPYTEDIANRELRPDVWLISAARCARVSYYKHDGAKPTEEEDMALGQKLLESGHLTPFEHQCVRVDDGRRCANLTGWRSKRYELERG